MHWLVLWATRWLFQSTLPVWGATCFEHENRRWHTNFNPRSPCGERLNYFRMILTDITFQSTLPVWGATLAPEYRGFQSTLPVWGATKSIYNILSQQNISIHAPRVGSDRRPSVQRHGRRKPFQSTLPVWGATQRY